VRALRLSVLTGEAEVLVDEELAGYRVAGAEYGNNNDDTERPKLRGNVFELSQTLGDSVRALLLLGDSHHAPRGHHTESPGSIHLAGYEGKLFCAGWTDSRVGEVLLDESATV